jgi:hypothetical protein
MRDWTPLRERYLRDPLPIQLGGIAANLERIRVYSQHESRCSLVENMIDESKYLIEWIGAGADLEAQTELVDIQIQLAVWQLNWQAIWNDVERRQQVARQAGQWSERLLELSGVLNAE